MPSQSPITDYEILEAALSGLQSQLRQTNERMASIRARLGIRGPRLPVVSTDGAQSVPKRKMSAAARKRIGEATRLRWKKFRKAKAEEGKPAAIPKRKMSAAGKARIVAATKKRWAAFHKEQKAAAKKMTPKMTRKAMKKAAPVAEATPATA